MGEQGCANEWFLYQKVCASGDVLTGMVLTRCLQGSAHQLRLNRF